MDLKKKQQVRLLVIDESENYLSAIRECIEMCPPDYELAIEFADSEGKTREIMKRWDPSVVLLDAHLPAVNALNMLEKYLAELVPVIVTSDTRCSEIGNSARVRGAVGYITKSENPDEIETLLERIRTVSIDLGVQH